MPRLIRVKSSARLEQVSEVRLDDYVNAVAFSADDRHLAACTASGQVAVATVPGLSAPYKLTGHDSAALAVTWLHGEWLASGGQDGTVRVWNATSGEERAVLPVGDGRAWVEHLAWDRRQSRLAASAGKTFRVWQCDEQGAVQPAAELADHKSTISSLFWAPAIGGLVTACYGGARLWKIGEAKSVRSFPYDGALIALALSPDGQYLASGNLDASVHVWRTATTQHWRMSGYPSKVRAVAFDATGDNLYTATGPELVAWDARQWEGSSGRVFKGHLGWIQQIACHPQWRYVATVGEDGLLCLWDGKNPKPAVAVEVNKQGGLACVAWSRAGELLVIGSDDGSVGLFRVEMAEGKR